MKIQPIKQNYVVLEQKAGLSKVTGHAMVTITLVGTKDRKEYITYIDSTNYNRDNWHHVVNNPDHGFVLDNLKVKMHKERLLIDADSKVIIAAEDLDKSRILDALTEVWAEQDAKANNKFKDLFE